VTVTVTVTMTVLIPGTAPAGHRMRACMAHLQAERQWTEWRGITHGMVGECRGRHIKAHGSQRSLHSLRSHNALQFPCLALTAWQHVAGCWWFVDYPYWYCVLVLAGPNNIGYWILGGFFGIVLTLFYSVYLW